jgi:hypothetical protein
VSGATLVDDWADTVRPRDGLGEEGKSSDGRVDRLDGEQVSHLVDWEPESWKGEQPEQEKAEEVLSVNASAVRETIVQGFVSGPNRLNHQSNVFA